jgi:hypothetical protein
VSGLKNSCLFLCINYFGLRAQATA